MNRKPPSISRDHFDSPYYKRFYENRDTSVVTPAMKRNEVAFVIGFCRHVGLDVERFADVGAGTGWWAREFARQYRSCRVIETFDASVAACERYGHRRVPLQRLSGAQADLIVCRDVLRYLSNGEAEEGIRRLARKCRGVLYLHVITREDEFDEAASDMKGHFRATSWYRQRLKSAGFRDCGMGLFVSFRLKSFSPWSIEAR